MPCFHFAVTALHDEFVYRPEEIPPTSLERRMFLVYFQKVEGFSKLSWGFN